MSRCFAENHMVLPRAYDAYDNWDEGPEACALCGRSCQSLTLIHLTEQPVELGVRFASLPVNVLACDRCHGVVSGEVYA